jgi:hypothetical protein
MPHIEEESSPNDANPDPVIQKSVGTKGPRAKSQWPDAGDLRKRDDEFPDGRFWVAQEGNRTSTRDKNRRVFRVKNTTAAG